MKKLVLSILPILFLATNAFAQRSDISSVEGVPSIGNAPIFDGSKFSFQTPASGPVGIENINRTIVGCGVVWTGAGLNFIVSGCTYYIAAVQYTSALTPLTLTAADATLDRIDVFIVNDSGVATFITGTPATPPAAPSVDPTTQIFLTFATVGAAATTPSNVVTEVIYKEDTGPAAEWACTESDASTNCASTNNPYEGTKDIEWTTAARNDFVDIEDSGTHILSAYNNLSCFIRSKATWASNRNLTASFRLAEVAVGTGVVISQGAFGFDSSQTATYQQIVIPVSLFGSIGTVDELRFTVTGGGGSQTIGLYIDNCVLQGGFVIAPPADFVSSIGVVIDGGGQAITTGVKGYANVEFSCTITQATLLADVSGNLVIDVWKDVYGNYPPTVADTITASAKPTLVGVIKSQDAGLAGWTKTVTARDTIGFNVDSAATVTRATLSLRCVR